jgi:hypothetical protein
MNKMSMITKLKEWYLKMYNSWNVEQIKRDILEEIKGNPDLYDSIFKKTDSDLMKVVEVSSPSSLASRFAVYELISRNKVIIDRGNILFNK